MNAELNDSDDEREEYRIHEGVIFLIHRTPSMENLEVIFEVILGLLKHLIKTLPYTGIGLYIINSAGGKSGIKTIFNLEDINEYMFRQLAEVLKLGEESFTGNDVYNWNEKFPIYNENIESSFGGQLLNVLHHCLVEFSKHKGTREYSNKKVFLFSDCFYPFNGNEERKLQLQTRLSELNNEKVTLYPYLIANNFNKNTSTDEFRDWYDIPANVDDDFTVYNKSTKPIQLEDIEKKILKAVEIKRWSFTCPLQFNKFKISVKGVSLFNPVKLKKVKYIQNDGKKHTVKTDSYFVYQGEKVNKQDIIKATEVYEGQNIPYIDELYQNVMNFGYSNNPGLFVKGTIPFTKFLPYITNESKIMIPDEFGENADSAKHFTAFYRSLVKQKKIAICYGSLRKSSFPGMYYIIPTGSNNLPYIASTENYPQQLALVEIPYGDEYRRPSAFLKDFSFPEIENEQSMEHIRKLIEVMKIDKFSLVPNPTLTWQIDNMIDAVMGNNDLQIDATKSMIDSEIKNEQLSKDLMFEAVEAQRQNIPHEIRNDILNYYSSLANSANVVQLQLLADAKYDNEPARKKAKIREPLNENNITLIFKNQLLQKYTVEELKAFVNSTNGKIPKATRKPAILENIESYLRMNNRLDE
ncbi:ATP-dependent DNA helicase [Martiniozyma asiatica (nom. inval.)]|nr:ATP-dependent DNA helicase [Martiniozyma asiatica]